MMSHQSKDSATSLVNWACREVLHPGRIVFFFYLFLACEADPAKFGYVKFCFEQCFNHILEFPEDRSAVTSACDEVQLIFIAKDWAYVVFKHWPLRVCDSPTGSYFPPLLRTSFLTCTSHCAAKAHQMWM